MMSMTTLLLFSALTAGFVAFDALAIRFGAESRPGFDERRFS